LGAHVIEKHFTLRRADGGPDAVFSLEPEELKQLCESCRVTWRALGQVDYTRKPSEEGNAGFRRSLYVVEDIAAGEAFTERNLRAIRPGHGLPPKHLKKFLGKPAKTAIKRGTPLGWSVLAE
jgi:N-acetylneuraminate synthase